MFSRLPFEELKTLKFVTEKAKEVKPKRKYTKKKKEEEKAAEEPMEVIPAEELYPEKIKVEESRD